MRIGALELPWPVWVAAVVVVAVVVLLVGLSLRRRVFDPEPQERAPAAATESASRAAPESAPATAFSPLPGDPIDPAIHNVVAAAPLGGKPPVVTRTIRPGWRGPDGVTRPADVEAGPGDSMRYG
ncbi:MAG: hypothetical protein Q4G46_16755 [Propionibacteriaceae bacterium]|nr:hypothetical protein [Propionibacteriaceae bacterium]